MALPTCPYCKKAIRANAKFCAKCGRALVAPPQNPKGLRDPSGLGGVKCPQCGTLNRAGARFCAKCRSDLPKMQKAPGQFTTRQILSALAGVAVVLLCLIGALAAYNARGKTPAVASNATAAPTPAAATTLTPTSGTPSPALTPASSPDYQVFADKQFGYEITVPKSWGVTALQGKRDEIPGSPSWSALIANVENSSLQSLAPDTDFVLSIYQEPLASEDGLLVRIADSVVAKPGEVLRREQGKTIEYYTTQMLPDQFGRPTAARWFWDGKNLLSIVVAVINSDAPEVKQLDQVLDSVRLTRQ